MKITQRLVGDHITFRKMLKELDHLADHPATQRDTAKLVRTVELFRDHLLLHAWAEDRFYYPVIREHLTKDSAPLTPTYMDHLDQEHHHVDSYLDQLEEEVKRQPPATYWPQTFALFAKGLLAHMKKEEEELFPISERVLGEEKLEELSKNLEKHRSEAPKVRMHQKA